MFHFCGRGRDANPRDGGANLLLHGRNEVVAKVIFLHLFVILFKGEGVCLSACWDTTPPPGADPPMSRPPGADTPREDTPRSRHPPEQTPPVADIPLSRQPPEQTPPRPDTPLGADTSPGADTPPPPEAQSGIRSMSGRYASYWNAFLFCKFFLLKIP